MYKEILIIIIVVVLIIGLNAVTNNYTTYAAESLSNQLNTLREKILNKEDNIRVLIDYLENNWNEYNEKLSYYIEHDELEKVGNGITAIKSHIEVKENNDAIENIDEVVFILKHIEDKEKFSMKSLF